MNQVTENHELDIPRKITSHEFIENHSNLTKYLNNPRNGGVSGGPENR